jgi:hypothetical protein
VLFEVGIASVACDQVIHAHPNRAQSAFEPAPVEREVHPLGVALPERLDVHFRRLLVHAELTLRAIAKLLDVADVAHVVFEVHAQELVDLAHELVSEVGLQVLVDLLVFLRIFVLDDSQNLVAVRPKPSEDSLEPFDALLDFSLVDLVRVEEAHCAVSDERTLPDQLRLLLLGLLGSTLFLCLSVKQSLSFSLFDFLLESPINLLRVLIVPKLVKRVSIHHTL